jgi:hypothetical protein
MVQYTGGPTTEYAMQCNQWEYRWERCSLWIPAEAMSGESSEAPFLHT